MARTNQGTNTLAQALLWVTIIGALNWGLVGFLNWDLVRAIFGGETTTPASGISRAIYALVGLAGIALAILAPRLRSARTDRAIAGRPAEVHP
jgi:uncharacterized membrane protein YuzA (DUF378 family)